MMEQSKMMEQKYIVGDSNPSMYGILDGCCKGMHWSCKKEDLDLDVLYSYCVGGCGVVGSIPDGKENDAKSFFESVFESLRKNNINEFEFSAEQEYLSKQILKIFSEKEVYSEEEYSFRRTMECSLEMENSDFDFIEVDKEILEHVDHLENSEMLTTRISESWYSIDDFLKYSKAVIAVKDNGIVGIIFGSARFKNVIDIDIEVVEEHRKKGVGKILTAFFVNACMKKGCVVQWDCIESNRASRTLAETCGFRVFKKRPYYWFHI